MDTKKIAVLIDAENISYKYIDDIFQAIRRDGKILTSRLYGQYDVIKQWEDACNKYSIKINTQFNFVKGKNTTDSRLIIDAMDIMYQDNVNTFYILSSDSDYTGLITRIKEDDKIVIGVGKQTTPEPLINACNKFLYIENLVSKNDVVTKQVQKTNISLSEIYKEVYRLISESNNNERQISQIIEKLNDIFPDFNLKNYDGVPHKSPDFIKSIDGIEVYKKADNTTYCARIVDEKKVLNFISKNDLGKNRTNLTETKMSIVPSLEDLNLLIINIFKKNKNEYEFLSSVDKEIKKKYPKFKIKDYGVTRFNQLIKLINKNFVFSPDKSSFKIKK